MRKSGKEPAPGPACPAVENPLTALARLYQEQMEICNRLEEIADGLGGDIDSQACNAVATDINRSMVFLHRFEENVLHPLVASRISRQNSIGQMLANLSDEHFSDQDYAMEIIELLAQLENRAVARDDLDRAGYMLRGFFETVRRHTRFEAELVLHQAREKLSVADLRALADQLQAHRMMAPVACTKTRVKIRTRRRV